MKVLFILSGNKANGSNLVENQASSLAAFDKNLIVDFYYVKGKGITGYLKNIIPLRKKIKEFNPDLLHAHYSFCGFLSVLALTKKPIITSLMGSDVQRVGALFKLIIFFSQFWKAIIVKSEIINNKKYKCETHVIPNGVNLNFFNPDNKKEVKVTLGLDPQKKHLLFLANPNRPEKNFNLAQAAFKQLQRADLELLVIYDIPHAQTINYLNASDVLILSSFYEGSPNVVKEAMACNLPVVSTNVGDVSWLFENTEGNFISEFTIEKFSEGIGKAVAFSEKYKYTNGREKLVSLKLNSESVAEKIINLYRKITKKPVEIVGKQICKTGVWDNTIPGISFNADGISNYADILGRMIFDFPRNEEGKEIWDSYVSKIKQKGLNKKYDCIIGLSGGTDSSYLLHIAKEYGLNPLAVYLDNGWASEMAVSNIEKMTKALNVDLETYVIDYSEVTDVLVSYLKAGLPWADSPTDLAIKAILLKKAAKHNIQYVLIGHDFRTEGFQPTEWTYSDSKQLKYITKKFSKRKLKSFPSLSLVYFMYLSYIKKIKLVRPFFYLNYNKSETKLFLKEKYNWVDYGGHHYENVFTKFIITYWLYEKFGIDKRKITYSALIINNEMSRAEALASLAEKPYTAEQIENDIDYLCKKLNLSKEDFQKMFEAPNHYFYDYPSYFPMINKFKKLAYPMVKYFLPNKPLFIYQSEGRQNNTSKK